MLLTQIGPLDPVQNAAEAVVPTGNVGVRTLAIVRPIDDGAARVSEPIGQPLVFVSVPAIENDVMFWSTDAGAMTRLTWHVPSDRVDNCVCSWNGCENALPANACGLHAPQVVGLPET